MAGNEVDINEKLLQIAKYNNKGQFEKAIKEYKQLLTSYRNDAKILNSMGDTYAKMQGETDNALRCYDQSADQYAKDGIWPTAIAILKKMLRMRPEKLDTKFKIADFCIQMKSFNEAEQYLIEYAEFYITAGDVQKAIPAYERVASISPDNMERKIKLAELYFFTGNTDKMLTTYQAVFNYYKAQKNIAKTQEIFNSITAISNKNQLLMTATYFSVFLGYIEFLLNDTQDDERAIGTAMDMVTRLVESGEFDKAQSLCTKIIELRPDAVNVRFKLIDILDKIGDKDSLVDAYVGVGNYFSERDISRAEVLYKKVLQLDPSNPDAKAFFGASTETKPTEAENSRITEKPAEDEDNPEHAVIEGAEDIIHSSKKHTGDADSFVEREGLGITSTFDESESEKDLGALDLTEVRAEEDDFKKKLSQDITFSPSSNELQEVPEFSPDEINDFTVKKEKKEQEVAVATTPETVVEHTAHDDDDDIEIEIEIDDDDVVTVGTTPVKQPEENISYAQPEVSPHEDIDDKLGSMFTEFAAPAEQGVSLLSEISDHENEFVPSLDKIVQDFKQGLEAQLEGDPQAHCDMGTSFLSMGMIDEAMDEFRKLTSIANYKYRSHDGLAQCLLARDEYDAAIEEYFIILEFPNLTQDEMDATHFNLARTYYNKGDLIESKRYLVLIQQQDLFSKNEEYKKMQETFKKELTITSDVPEITIGEQGELTTEVDSEQDEIAEGTSYRTADLNLGNEEMVEALEVEKEPEIMVESSGIESGALIEGVTEVMEEQSDEQPASEAVLQLQNPFDSAESEIVTTPLDVQHTPHIEDDATTPAVVENRVNVPAEATFSLKGQEKLELEINKLRKEILAAKDAVSDSNDKLQEAQDSIKGIENELHELREVLQDIVQFKDSVGDIHEEVEAIKASTETSISEIRSDFTARLDAFEAKDSDITNDITQLKTDMEGYRDLSVREKEILNQFMKYREDFDAFADEISGMKEMVKKGQLLESRIEEIAKTLERVSDIEKKTEEFSHTTAVIAALEDRFSRLETVIQGLQDTNTGAAQVSHNEIVDEQDALRREIVSLKSLIHDIDSKVYMLEMRKSEEPREKTPRNERVADELPPQNESYGHSDTFSEISQRDIPVQDEVLFQDDIPEKPVKKQSRKNKKDKISFL